MNSENVQLDINNYDKIVLFLKKIILMEYDVPM